MQYFADEDDSGFADAMLDELNEESPTGEESGAEQGDDSESKKDDPYLLEIEKLKAQYEAEKKRAMEAERLIEKNKQEEKIRKRESMSEAEKLEDERKDLAEKHRQFDIKMNTIDVQGVFVEAGLNKDQYDPLIDLIVSEDGNKSSLAAKEIVRLINEVSDTRTKLAEQDWMKRSPTPPSGEEEKDVDPFLEAFDSEWDKS